MEYQPSQVALQFDLKDFENAADADLMKKVIATKFQEWKYENEWRILYPLEFNLKHPRPEYFYEQFTPDFELREIILGTRCDRTLEEIKNQVFGATAPVQVKRARPAFDSFSMVQQKLQYSITVNPYSNFTKSELRLAAAERYARASQAERERRGKSKR